MALAPPSFTITNNGMRKGRLNSGIAANDWKGSLSSRLLCSATNEFTSPKTGTVGEDRFRDALPGTYWGKEGVLAEGVNVSFNTGGEKVEVTARVGENLLRVAERAGVIMPDQSFCFQGSCFHCEMEVLGGAKEVGKDIQSSSGNDELIQSCLCPVPAGRSTVEVNLISEDDVWSEGVI